MSKRSVVTRARAFGVAVAIAGVVGALLPGAAASAGPGDPGPPATFTTTNGEADGGYFCINGPAAQDPVNCNLYERKEHVWLNGGPDLAHLGDGDYFFVVLEPGGQNDGLLDTGLDNLSSRAGNPRADRTFTVSNGSITYTGTHTLDSNK